MLNSWQWIHVFNRFPFYTIGIFLFTFSLCVYLSKHFVNINLDLIDLTINLENKVEERTKQIELLAEQKTNYFLNLAHETKNTVNINKQLYGKIY